MATKAGRARADARDEVKAQQRFFDQPGQWISTTPASVKKRQQVELKKLQAMMKKKK